jgi:hypothetical protein
MKTEQMIGELFARKDFDVSKFNETMGNIPIEQFVVGLIEQFQNHAATKFNLFGMRNPMGEIVPQITRLFFQKNIDIFGNVNYIKNYADLGAWKNSPTHIIKQRIDVIKDVHCITINPNVMERDNVNINKFRDEIITNPEAKFSGFTHMTKDGELITNGLTDIAKNARSGIFNEIDECFKAATLNLYLQTQKTAEKLKHINGVNGKINGHVNGHVNGHESGHAEVVERTKELEIPLMETCSMM